jgi:hypothetical protein
VKNKEKYKPKMSVVDNAIERLMRDDKYILMLIERVGSSKMQDLITDGYSGSDYEISNDDNN